MCDDVVRFGDFHLNAVSGELHQGDKLVRLQPQPTKVLMLLVQRPGEIVTREELQVAVWGSDTVVDFDNGLNWAIRKVRETLGDDTLNPKFIETIPKKGYRFVAPTHTATECPPKRSRAYLPAPVFAIIAVLTMVFLFLGVASLEQHRDKPHTTVVVLPFDNLTGQSDRDFIATAATDQLIVGIGSRSDLNVIDRATAAKLKRTEECIIHIGEQLRADLVVEGSVVGPPSAPVITAGIYRVDNNTKLWAGQIPLGDDSGVSAYRVIAAKVSEFAR